MISTAGLPIAVSIMVSKSRVKGRRKECGRIFSVALSLFFVLGLSGTAFMFFGAKPLAAAMGSDMSYLAIIAVSPTLFFICLSSAVRGYFQGHQNMLPTAVSEVLEAVGKFSVGIALGYYAVNRGYSVETVAAYAITGITIGVALGMIFLVLCKLLSKREYGYPPSVADDGCMTKRALLKELLTVSLPITIGAVALNMTGLIDTFTIINCMKPYAGEVVAETAYGNYTTLAVTLFHLPSAFIYPIASALTPALSGAVASGNKASSDSKISSAFKLTSVLSVPSAFGMAILARPILSMLFTSKESSYTAGPLLSVLSAGLLFTSLLTLSTSVLQSFKLEKLPVISMLAGIAVKAGVNIILIGNQSIGIYGAAIGSVAGYFVMALTNMVFITVRIKPQLNIFRLYYKPVISAMISSVFTVLSFRLLSERIHETAATLLSIIITVLIYFILLAVLKEFTKEDIMTLPKGEKIYRLLVKLHAVR